jgi:hypothetical protein
MTWQEEAAARQRQAQEQAASAERGRKQNIELFTKMWLSLGADVLKLEGTRHDQELAEAKGLAAYRWNQLHQMEQQVVREEQLLATRPKTRPAQFGDEQLPDRTLDERNRQWQDETKHRRAALSELKEQAKTERQLLESLVTKRK